MISGYLQTLRRFSRDVRLYLVSAALIGFTIFGGIYTVLLNLYLLRLGYDAPFIGLVNAAGPLALGIFCLPAGALGGRWGSRRAMIAGLILSVPGFGLLPLAEFVPAAAQPAWLLAMYVIGYLGFATYLVNSNPFLTDITTASERSHAFSLQAALWPLAGFAGSLIGGVLPGLLAGPLQMSLDHPQPYRYPLIFAALLLIPGVMALLAIRPGGHARERVAATEPAPRRLIILLAVITLLQMGGEAIARTFFNVYLDTRLQVSTALIGALVGVGQLLAVPAALATPILAARWGIARTAAIGSAGIALSLVPLAFFSHWAAAGLSFMGVIALASIRRPLMTVYSMELVRPAWRAAMSGATTMAVGLSWAAIAWGGGYLIAALGYRSLFLSGAGLTGAGALLFWAYFLQRDPERA